MMTEIDWAYLLGEEDVESLWNGLYQLVSRHPAVRPLHFATDGAAVTSPAEINADLAQELFLELFQKQRFDHYTANRYTSSEIENELAHIEIPNLVGARLRKRYPESFRMARRVSSLLKQSERFRRFGRDRESVEGKPARRGRPPKKGVKAQGVKAQGVKAQGVKAQTEQTQPTESDSDLELLDHDLAEGKHAEKSNGVPRRRMVSQVFGLKAWAASKPIKDSGHFSELVKSVPVRRRDTRIVGRSGSSQLIISNPDLEDLIAEVLAAIDSPADVRTIRQLVLSKIPLQDYNVASLDEPVSSNGDGSTIRRDTADTRETPEGILLREEQSEQAARMAYDFLLSLRRAVNNNERRFGRLLATMWYCYYDPEAPSQIEIARQLGISDSLVSDNRRLIEHELKKLKLSVEDGLVFSESLQRLLAQANHN
jgi:hypothetical protein